MEINKLRGTSEPPTRADKSAVGAINRPLRRAGLILFIQINSAQIARKIPATFIDQLLEVLDAHFSRISAQIARKIPAIFIDELLEVLDTKISSPQQWDILANSYTPKHNLKHIDIQWVSINT